LWLPKIGLFFEVSTSFVYQIVPRVIVLIDLVGPGFRISSDFQRQSLARQSDGESVKDSVEGKQVEDEDERRDRV
jgi:hypothetical protein